MFLAVMSAEKDLRNLVRGAVGGARPSAMSSPRILFYICIVVIGRVVGKDGWKLGVVCWESANDDETVTTRVDIYYLL